jgi:hypothetical protein
MLTTAGFEPATRADINLGGVSTKKRNRHEAQDIKPMMGDHNFRSGGHEREVNPRIHSLTLAATGRWMDASLCSA